MSRRRRPWRRHDPGERYNGAMQQTDLPTPSIHFGDAVRAAVPLGVAYGLTRFALSPSYQLDPVGWALFVLLAATLVYSGVRVALLEARPPRDHGTVLTRTRELGPLTELIIAGSGGCLLCLALVALLLGFSVEVPPSSIGRPPIQPSELVMALVMFGLPGFFMIYWRPMFVIDLSRGVVRRLRFGRALGRGAGVPASQMRVYSEGYFITNRGVRLGDMVRGKVGKHTFELEMIRGNLAREHIDRRVAWWAQALHTTPATADELQQA